ncbi:NeuD/PglB/VioB family sugar acetyltransferase [Winogradskyella eckloniae]|uniref:NeuD/PglB/VioB family sugar acetyltransferase n=1 Tax=Winogradskyella eckloniae TaxID=1089306 RepID=UPI0015642B24|nr:NeuD/PglB/VioB family sugar acetyltransferase [Winogradskyella eckloniae]NRD20806.1 NeuD/PglB/VioB family sugar acetyltransferase [Winogradskyella eckloniae]
MKVTNIVVFCAGPQTRVIIDILQDQPEYQIVGIIDSVIDIGNQFYGYTVIGRQNEVNALAKTYNFEAGIVGLGDNYLREKVVLEILEQNKDFTFINALSKFAYISPTAKIGVGNVIMPGVIINSEANMLNHCVINTNSSLEHNCKMEDFSSLSAGVTTGGYFNLGKYSAIALGVTILDRTTIGENVVVGSGSLVVKDLESHGLYYGSPAKRIRDRKPFERFLK